MKPGILYREPATVLMHLNEGFTRVVLDRTLGAGQADGGICWDIATEKIPVHLRGIGSRFLLIGQMMTPEPNDPPELIRAAIDNLTVEPLPKSP